MTDLPGEKVGKNAALISGITMLSRIAGLGRILVLTWAVGMGGVLDVYNTANRVPNILYEIAAGGALAALVVPLLAAPLARRQPEVVNRTASGLLTWSVLLLVPMGVLVAVLAEPVMRLLAGDAPDAEIAMGTRMIQVFAPQLPLYGIGVVLTGVLHTHRRFAWPALAPLLSSLTVIAAYVVYGLVAPQGADAAQVSLGQELVLSIGTTLATVVMTFCLLIPLRRVGIRLRPTLRFGGGDVTRNVRTMAVAGGLSIAAWQLSLLLILGLTNGGLKGTVGLFSIALTLYMLPWGVFAMPLALSSYPALAEAHGVGDRERYDTTLSTATRRVVLLAFLGAAALIGLAVPLATVFAEVGGTADVDPGLAVVPAMSAALVALAPGLVGFSLYPLLTRALYARGATVAAAVATVGGWAVAYVAAIVCSVVMPVADRALAVGVGNSVGMVVLGAALAATVAWRAGRASLTGVWRAALVGVVSSAVSAAAGWWVSSLFGASMGLPVAVVALAASGLTVLLVFGAVAFLVDRRDMRPLVGSVAGRLFRRRSG
ncbi:murein biosynthesis integral membrane protein MurJ [Stackebrandtia albiflava]|uniref:murein biosynthesis integral membrane protein MurJ n=1 Tax=Stackebrandtia albiflava TaxID=406432 RepID=UPI0011BEDBE0|nr:lipid II flippase MurJ [Stackebrandtia albiflava]